MPTLSGSRPRHGETAVLLIRPALTRRGLVPTALFVLAPIVLSACRSQEAAPPTPTAPVSGGRAGAEAWFEEITEESGLAFLHRSDLDGSFYMPQNMGSGGALFDFDGDGDLDIYLVNSGSHRGRAEISSVNRLFRHDGGGRFVDHTEASRLGDAGYGMGTAVGDADGDGDLDVYVTNFGRDAFYLNDGRGGFTEITTKAGLGSELWSTSACFFDFDEDGRLDIYVSTYVAYDPPRSCTDPAGRPEYCGPSVFRGEPDLLYRNESTSDGLAFTEVHPGGPPNKGLGVICTDLDGDGRDDIYVANDGEPNSLWINRGDGRFDDQSLVLGAATNFLGQPEASMGIALGDIDGDFDLDLFLTHLDRETNTLYLNLEGSFQDATASWDVGRDSLPLTGFGATFFDAENDGDLDLLLVNGRVRRGQSSYEGAWIEDGLPEIWRRYAEPNLFYRNENVTTFRNRSEEAGALTSRIEVSRALLAGDLDQDGALDILVTHSNGPARLYANRAPAPGHWLDVRLPRTALGARLFAVTGEKSQLGVVTSTYGYLSSIEPFVHFGLGQAERVDRLDVHWPDGSETRVRGLPVDRRIVGIAQARSSLR